jgi:hypothetical protein
MGLEFVESPAPKDVTGIWRALVDLVRSIIRREPVSIPVTFEAAGLKIVTHPGRNQGVPRLVIPVLRGDEEQDATVTVGKKDPRQIWVYASAPCTAELVVYFA